MKPHSLFWPVSASFVTFTTGAIVSWAYLSGLPPAVINSPLWFVVYSVAGLVPLILGATMAIKTLRRLELVSSIGQAWHSPMGSHWFRLSAAVVVFAGGVVCSIWIADIGHVNIDTRVKDIVVLALIGVLPIYVTARIAWWMIPHAPQCLEAGKPGVEFWPTVTASASLIEGCAIVYVYYAEPSLVGGYVSTLNALMDLFPGLLPAIWGTCVIRRLVNFERLMALSRQPSVIAGTKRFLVGLAGSAILAALCLAAFWARLAHQDWRTIYAVSVFLAIPAALGLWAAARVVKKAEGAEHAS